MGALLSSMFGAVSGWAGRKPESTTLMIVGPSGAGKTTLMWRFSMSTVPVPSGLGFNLPTAHCHKRRVTLLGLGGAGPMRGIRRGFLSQVQGVIYVVDSAQLTEVGEEARDDLEELASELYLRDRPFLIVANKQDVGGALPPDEVARELRLGDVLTRYHWRVVGSTGHRSVTGMEAGIDWLLANARR